MTTLEFIGNIGSSCTTQTPEIDLEGSRSCGKNDPSASGKNSKRGTLSRHVVADRALPQTMRRKSCSSRNWNASRAFTHGPWRLEQQGKTRVRSCRPALGVLQHGLQTCLADTRSALQKIRGLSVSRNHIDQADKNIPGDIASELRFRYDPTLPRRKAENLSAALTFSPNPADTQSLARETIPDEQFIKGRRYYSLSLYDNRHNLPPE